MVADRGLRRHCRAECSLPVLRSRSLLCNLQVLRTRLVWQLRKTLWDYEAQVEILYRYDITKASYASWSSSCFSKEYARGWTRGFIDTINVYPPPWRLVTLRSWVQPPSVHRVKNSGIYSVFCITGLWNPGKMHIFEVFRLPFHLGCLDRLQIQHEEKGFIVSASSNMAVLASIWGAFFFLVTFKLPFHALPLLSPHPASFRSFTPGASSIYWCIIPKMIPSDQRL